VDGEVPGAPRTPEEMQTFVGRVVALEDEMEASGTLVFGAAIRRCERSTAWP